MPRGKRSLVVLGDGEVIGPKLHHCCQPSIDPCSSLIIVVVLLIVN
jgi:hypothetical protein